MTACAAAALQQWRDYRRQAFADDAAAAITVTALLLPQSLAYALLAGLPPVAGLMASLLPILAYAAFGSSKVLAVGPVAVLSMMTAQAIGPAAEAHGVPAHLAALVLTLEVAAVLGVAAALRLEVFAALLSVPVLHGFITGAALVIALGQVTVLLGAPVRGNTLVEGLQSLADQLGSGASLWHGATAAMGLTALALLWALRRHGLRLATALGLHVRPALLASRMAPAFVVVAAIAVVLLWPGAVDGVALAGRIDLGNALDFPSLAAAPAALWLALVAPATLLALVAYVEGLAIAEALAARRGDKVSPRRELLGLAAANAAAGATGGLPVTGGFARSVVSFDAGARTRMAGVWTALLLAGVAAACGPLLGLLPRTVLAATIIVAVLSMIDLQPFAHAWRYSRVEFVLMAGVAGLTVVSGVELALSVGVLAAVGILLQRTARPHWAEVGRLPGSEIFRNVRRFPVETLPGVLAVRIDESLLFTNTRWLAQTMTDTAQQRPGLRHVVLMMSGVNDIDLTGLEGLMQLTRELQAQGVQLHLSELKGPVADRLATAGLAGWLSGRVFQTQADAHRALGAMADD
jgi:sulfate permease, SulP family